jgi:hypothetical protein
MDKQKAYMMLYDFIDLFGESYRDLMEEVSEEELAIGTDELFEALELLKEKLDE